MNFKDRGITVGDLLITVLIISSLFFIYSKRNQENDPKNISSLSMVDRAVITFET